MITTRIRRQCSLYNTTVKAYARAQGRAETKPAKHEAANTFIEFTAPQRACLPCEQRPLCLRHPEKTKVRQVVFFTGRAKNAPENFTARMKKRIDSEQGRQRYAQRFATVEPVFGNIRRNKRMNRFTLRGQTKVDGQCKLFCLVHSIEKLAHHRYAQ